MSIKKRILFSAFVSLFASMTLCGCSLKNKSEKNEALSILYEDVTEGCLYKRAEINQVIQIPIIVNHEIDNITISDIIGENIDMDSIAFSGGITSQEDSAYVYILSLVFDWKNYKYKTENVILDRISFIADGNKFDYDLGTIEIINQDIYNKNDAIEYGSLGTGYSDLSFIDFSLDINKNVEITSIDTTINLPISNKSDYIKKYNAGSRQEFQLTADDSNYDKLYYLFDISVNYLLDNEEYVYYFSTMPVQTSIEGRLQQYIDSKST